MRSFEAFKRRMLKNPKVKAEYDAQEGEFTAHQQLIEADITARRTKRFSRPNRPKTFGSRSR